jgi:hypothetical protein
LHIAEDIEAIATTMALGTTAVVVLLFGIQTVLCFAIQAHPVFVILALLPWVTQALLPWVIQAAIQAAKVKVILVSRQVTQEIMGTQEVLSISDNKTHWFVPWIVILVRGTGKESI